MILKRLYKEIDGVSTHLKNCISFNHGSTYFLMFGKDLIAKCTTDNQEVVVAYDWDKDADSIDSVIAFINRFNDLRNFINYEQVIRLIDEGVIIENLVIS